MTHRPPAAPGVAGKNPQRWWILAVLTLALFVVVLDNTVLSVAVPSLTTGLDASTSELQWVFNAYSLVLAGLVLTTGSLADRFGRKRMLLLGLVLFGAGSAVAAFAGSPGELIAARAGMGLGAAFLMPGTLAVIVQVFDDDDRPKAIGIWAGVLSLGMAAGPVVGGALLSSFWWGSVFLINLPVIALTLVATVGLVPESREVRASRPDVLGALLSVVFGAALVYAVISVPEHGWRSTEVMLPFLLGVGALVAFVVWELRSDHPMLDMTFFRDPQFAGAAGAGALIAFALGGALFLFTQYLQFILGYSPLEAGLRIAPMAITVLVASGLSVKVLAGLGASRALALGIVVIAAGLVALSRVGADSGYLPTLAGLLLLGTGIGIGGPVASNALMGAIPKERAGIGSGVNSTLQELGGAVGVAVLGSIMAVAFGRLLPDVVPDEAGRSLGAALQIAAASPDPATVVREVQEAFVSGMSTSLLVGAAAALLAAGLSGALLRRAERERGRVPAPVGPAGQEW